MSAERGDTISRLAEKKSTLYELGQFRNCLSKVMPFTSMLLELFYLHG